MSASRALASTTRASIYDHLREDDESCTVRDVAERFSLHPNVARTHLELLADAGLLVVGRRKHPGGGRPAKVYRAAEAVEAEIAPALLGDQPGARLQIRLLAELVDHGTGSDLERAAQHTAMAEGRRLVEPLVGEEAVDLRTAAELSVRALRPHVGDIRLLKDDGDWADVTGLGRTFEPVAAIRPALADAFQRGLLEGAFAAAGSRVAVAGAGALPEGDRVWRARLAKGSSGARTGPPPAKRVDARGMPREQGVVRAMREVITLRQGQVLEVLAEGPGSPAAFARWADRAGHELLGVERAADEGGKPGIRLLIRKGRA